jgi:hypothetical protein
METQAGEFLCVQVCVCGWQGVYVSCFGAWWRVLCAAVSAAVSVPLHEVSGEGANASTVQQLDALVADIMADSRYELMLAWKHKPVCSCMCRCEVCLATVSCVCGWQGGCMLRCRTWWRVCAAVSGPLHEVSGECGNASTVQQLDALVTNIMADRPCDGRYECMLAWKHKLVSFVCAGVECVLSQCRAGVCMWLAGGLYLLRCITKWGASHIVCAVVSLPLRKVYEGRAATQAQCSSWMLL